MMNYDLPFVPERPAKPRDEGLTMMMDKGMSIAEAQSFVQASAEYTDLVKFGFGTSLISSGLYEKIAIYKEAGLKPYFGGTLFELFVVRNMFDDFRRYVDKYEMDTVEVSDGSMAMSQDEKLKYIEILSKDYTVLSEIGSKQAGIVLPMEQWIEMMQNELSAGSWKVIAEARESGNVGIYNKDGSANTELVSEIAREVNPKDILWEAPNKAQQVWFVKLFGANVNLGNIATNEVIPLETIRLGFRGDTFLDYLPEEIAKERRQK